MLIEQTVKSYLDETLERNVYLEMPNNMPNVFVVFHIVDRGKVDQINAATLEFYSYAPSKYEAAMLDETLREVMDEIAAYRDVSCRFGGGNDDFDMQYKKYRYRCYYNLYY